jgi:hypothetical protein
VSEQIHNVESQRKIEHATNSMGATKTRQTRPNVQCVNPLRGTRIIKTGTRGWCILLKVLVFHLSFSSSSGTDRGFYIYSHNQHDVTGTGITFCNNGF